MNEHDELLHQIGRVYTGHGGRLTTDTMKESREKKLRRLDIQLIEYHMRYMDEATQKRAKQTIRQLRLLYRI